MEVKVFLNEEKFILIRGVTRGTSVEDLTRFLSHTFKKYGTWIFWVKRKKKNGKYAFEPLKSNELIGYNSSGCRFTFFASYHSTQKNEEIKWKEANTFLKKNVAIQSSQLKLIEEKIQLSKIDEKSLKSLWDEQKKEEKEEEDKSMVILRSTYNGLISQIEELKKIDQFKTKKIEELEKTIEKNSIDLEEIKEKTGKFIEKIKTLENKVKH